MVFWDSNYSTGTPNRFIDLRFKKEDIPFPLLAYELERDIIKIREIRYFLKAHFGGPNRPVFDIPEDILYGKKDIILCIKNKEIIGCIRCHYIGLFIDKPMYCIDCFCIHPSWRKKGIGDYLLTKLHTYNHITPYCIFLKEGLQLPIIHQPFYSGTYVYRKIENIVKKVSNIKTEKAYKLMDIFCEFNPIFIIRNKDADQHWRLYNNGIDKVLACIQDTYQYIDGKKMGWITAWIESPHIKYEEASIELSNSMYGIFDYIWGNKQWIGKSKEWKTDGQFHWYLYQWNTNINITNSYCILQ